jgi:hypothetical protein
MPDDVTPNEPVTYVPASGARFSEVIDRVSWGAVWAGVMIALGMEALFALFGLFIGFGMYKWQAANPWGGITAWSTAWYLVTAGWSMFFGAWCAGRLSGNPNRGATVLHGITTWGLATAFTVLFITVFAWVILREGLNVLAAATLVGAATGTANLTAQNAGPIAQATTSVISGLALRLWVGVLLGFITAILGGLLGRGPVVLVRVPETTAAPTRLAA